MTSIDPSRAPVPADRPSEAERRQRRIDDLAQQVLQARDAAIGAEAELGVARARVAELEQQVHVRDVEIDELRSSLAGTGGRSAPGLVRRVVRRVTRSAGSPRA